MDIIYYGETLGDYLVREFIPSERHNPVGKPNRHIHIWSDFAELPYGFFDMDREPTVSLSAGIPPNTIDRVINIIEIWAEEHGFQLVIQSTSSNNGNSRVFSVKMRKNEMRVSATNWGSPSSLSVMFFKTVRKELRPANETTQDLAQEFAYRLAEVGGANVGELIFTDRDE
jgi:hypothetical protein